MNFWGFLVTLDFACDKVKLKKSSLVIMPSYRLEATTYIPTL